MDGKWRQLGCNLDSVAADCYKWMATEAAFSVDVMRMFGRIASDDTVPRCGVNDDDDVTSRLD